jgi:hypothetical protein
MPRLLKGRREEKEREKKKNKKNLNRCSSKKFTVANWKEPSNFRMSARKVKMLNITKKLL